MMGVDQARQNDQIARIDDAIGGLGHVRGRADGGDRTVLDEDRSVANLALGVVERGDERRPTNQECSDLSRTS